jgi:hypothetical protein
MPSFDIVSKVDMAEVKNAVIQATKEIGQRYDFRGSKADIKEVESGLMIIGDDDYKISAVKDILLSKLNRRGVDIQNLIFGKTEPGANQTLKQQVTIQQGIPQDQAKEITKMIKAAKLKVQAQIQDDQLRVTGKKRDDLQEVIALLKGHKSGVALQFVNMRD